MENEKYNDDEFSRGYEAGMESLLSGVFDEKLYNEGSDMFREGWARAGEDI